MTIHHLLKTFLGGIMLTMATAAQSSPVDHDQALATARQFMASRGIYIPATATSRAIAPGNAGTTAPLYAFNAERGYVIVSGDDRTAPVLGYADSGTFDEDNLPDGLRWMLQSYKEQIAQLDDLFAMQEDRKLTTVCSPSQIYHMPARHSVEPLLTMTWNQDDPYNQLCPVYYRQDGSEGGHSATGCVATAMAQVVGYYRWPERTKRTIPGYVQKYSTDQGEKSVRLNSIPAGSVIDWDNILDHYNGSETEAQKKAIAELMLWIGMDCKMTYGESSSSGYSEGIDGLVNYFDYDDGTHVAKRDMYTLQQWNDLIYNEIATGHPVPFGGQNSGGGHAFVLDGYDVEGLFHVNWGWGGMSNGYFRIDVLDPDNNSGIGASLTPGGYNMGQDAIIGMKRPDGQKADEEDTPQYRYKLTANDWELRDANKFFANYINWSGVSANWNMGIGYVNEEGRLTAIGNYATVQLNQNYYVGLEFTVSGLPEGNYHIVPISKRATDTAWRTNMSPELRYVYTEVDADGNFTKMEMRPVANIAMTGLSFTGNHKRGDNQPVSATFRNDADDELFTEIHLLASQSNDKGGSKSHTLLNLPAGQEATIALNFKPEQAGLWNIWLATDWNGEHIVGEGQIEVTDEGIASGRQLRYMSHTISNRSGGNVYGNCFQGRVTIQNTNSSEPFDGMVRLWLFKQADNGYFYDAGSLYVPMQIEPRRTAQAPYYFGNLEMGANYAMSILYSEGGDIQDGGLRSMGRPQPGIICWQQNLSVTGMAPQATLNTPSGALAVDMTGAADFIKAVRPNSNPNTLYLLSPAAANVPEGLDDCNVVMGNHAERITLDASYSFFTPSAFTANEATFTCPADTQWQTVVLPFTPQQLPAGLRMATFTETTAQGEPRLAEVKAIERHLPYLMLAATAAPQTFSAAEARFTPTANAAIAISAEGYTFEGTTVSGRQQQVYMLNDEGRAFEPAEGQVAVKPFTAWFRAPEGAPAITLPDELTSTQGIGLPTPDAANGHRPAIVYDLQGRPTDRSAGTRHPAIHIIQHADGKTVKVKK